jgi:hypothetical protein
VTGLAVGGSAGFIIGRAIERRLVHDVGAISQTVLPATVWWVAVVTLMGCLMAGSITAALAVRHRAGFALRAE